MKNLERYLFTVQNIPQSESHTTIHTESFSKRKKVRRQHEWKGSAQQQELIVWTTGVG